MLQPGRRPRKERHWREAKLGDIATPTFKGPDAGKEELGVPALTETLTASSVRTLHIRGRARYLSHRQRLQAGRGHFAAGPDSDERTDTRDLSSEIRTVRHLLVKGAKAPLASALADRATVAASWNAGDVNTDSRHETARPAQPRSNCAASAPDGVS